MESFNSMYLAAGLLLSFYCDAPFIFQFIIEQIFRSLHIKRPNITGSNQFKNFQAPAVKSFLVCFGLPSTNKKLFTFPLASLAMTKILCNRSMLQTSGVVVIARPLVKNAIILSSQRPKQSTIIEQIRTNR